MKRTKEIPAILLSIILLMVMVPSMQVLATAPGTASGDNSLSSLSLSAGSLSPAFQYNVTDYTASVGQDVSSVEVSAKTSNANAVVESISGNTDLQPGQNTISIIVKAENGVTATYKIVVTRAGTAEGAPEQGAEAPEQETEAPEQGAEAPAADENQGGISIDGHTFDLSAAVPDDVVPQDFTKTTVTCQGQEVEGLQFDKGNLKLVYLTTPSAEVKNTLAVYEEASGVFSPFRRIAQGESSYFILLNPPPETGLPQTYSQSSQTIGSYQNVPVFVKGGAGSQAGDGAGGFQGAETEESAVPAGGNEFALVYAVSSFGNTGWYQYDTAESTFQRYQLTEEPVPSGSSEEQQEEPSVEMQGLQNAYKSLEEQFNQKKDSSRKTTAVLIFLIAVLVIVIVNLLLRGRREEDDLEDEEEYEELEQRQRRRAQRKQEKQGELLKSSAQKRSADHLREEGRTRKNIYGEDRLRQDSKTRRTVRGEDAFEEEAKTRKAARRERAFGEEPKTRKADYREHMPREEHRSRRTDRWDDGLLEEPKTRRRTRWEDEPGEEPKVSRKNRQAGGMIREQETALPKKLEKIDDDFEVIDLEDL